MQDAYDGHVPAWLREGLVFQGTISNSLDTRYPNLDGCSLVGNRCVFRKVSPGRLRSSASSDYKSFLFLTYGRISSNYEANRDILVTEKLPFRERRSFENGVGPRKSRGDDSEGFESIRILACVSDTQQTGSGKQPSMHLIKCLQVGVSLHPGLFASNC